jgi:hypothetical protein
VYTLEPMNKLELARRLARESHRSRAQAADDVDALVHRMIKDLKEQVEKQRSNAPDGAVEKPESQKGTR